MGDSGADAEGDSGTDSGPISDSGSPPDSDSSSAPVSESHAESNRERAPESELGSEEAAHLERGRSKGSRTRTGTRTRTEIQRRLEEAIRENRFTIAVVFPVVGAVTLVASAEGLLPEYLAYNPLLILFGTLVMRSPLAVGVLPQIDRRALAWLGLLTAYTYAIETVGVRTDWPYGAFEYTIQLGPMLFGEVPLALPVFFVPLVLNAYLLTLLVLGSSGNRTLVRLATAAAAVVAVDAVLDPAAVAIGFWAFVPPGGYYGVPPSNYLGWALSGTVAVVLVDLAFDRDALLERVRSCEFVLDDLVSFVLLWGTINVLYGNWLAAAVAGAFCVGLFETGRYDLEMVRTAIPGTSRR